jgi:multiple sugar transport system permease protein
MVLATWPDSSSFTVPPHLFFGNGLADNWERLFSHIHLFRNMFNSIAIAAASTITQLFFCTMGGFAFAMYRFKGKEILFKLMIITFAIPPALNIIPFFQIIIRLGWYNTWLPLIVPGVANAFGIFLMSQYIRASVPVDLLDAARIDGLSEFRILLRIVFPLSRSGLYILGILVFIGSWNEFLSVLIFLPDPLKTTLPVAIKILSNKNVGGIGSLMLGNMIAVVPLTLVLVIFSRKIIGGIVEGAVKG